MPKEALRKKFLTQRQGLDEVARRSMDVAIVNQFWTLQRQMQPAVVLSYLSFGQEVDTSALITRLLDTGVPVALPRCRPSSFLLDWYLIRGPEELKYLVKSPLGMEEPDPDHHQILDLGNSADMVAIVPALAFDYEGNRLGYGKGYYDRFLAAFDGLAVGLCRSPFWVKELAGLEPTDVPVDMVITDQGVYDLRSGAVSSGS